MDVASDTAFSRNELPVFGTRILRRGERKTNRQHKFRGADGLFSVCHTTICVAHVFRAQNGLVSKR